VLNKGFLPTPLFPAKSGSVYNFDSKQSTPRKLYTERLKIQFMIQQRQFRKQHPDQHYAAAIFRYERQYACMFRQHCAFLSIDDKHRIKVGEPNFPVAAAERGRQVVVSMNKSFQVGDHNFHLSHLFAL